MTIDETINVGDPLHVAHHVALAQAVNGFSVDNTAVASDWLAGAEYATGQLLVNAGVLYRVTANHTAPGSFDGVNLSAVSGVAGINGLNGAVYTGVVTLAAADLSDGSTLRTATQITNEITTAFNAASGSALGIDSISGTAYEFVSTDKGREKRTLDNTGGVGVAVIPSDADLTAAGTAIEIGQTLALRQYGTTQFSFVPRTWQKAYTASNAYNAASQNSYSVTLPAAGSGAAQLQDHDSYLVGIALPVGTNRTWTSIPSGFSQIDIIDETPTDLGPLMWGPTGCQVALFEKLDITATTDGGQTLTFTHSGSNVQGAIVLMGIRDGVRTGSMVDVIASTTTANSKTAPGLVTATANATEINVAANASGNTTADTAYTAPAGMTIAVEAHTTNNGGAAPNVSIALGYGASWTPATETLGVGPSGTTIPPRIWTTTGGANVGAAATLSVKPRTGMSVGLHAAGGAYFKTAAKYAQITATKEAADEWVVDGYAAI